MVVVSLCGDGRTVVPGEWHCCAVPVKRSRSDQQRMDTELANTSTDYPIPSNDHNHTRREKKLNWPCHELLMIWYSQLCPLSFSSFGYCRIGKPVGCGVELICDPCQVLPENHESATNPHGIFKF